MHNCQHYSEQLLDYLYGLLEEEESGQLCAHLEACPACRQEMEQARDEQQLLAQAARIYKTVPVFVAPQSQPAGDEALKVSASAETVEQCADTVALGSNPSRRQATGLGESAQTAGGNPVGRRAMWAGLAAAAAVLLAVGVSAGLYQRGLVHHEEALAEARKEVQRIDADYLQIVADFQSDEKRLPDRLQQSRLHLHIHGSSVYQPGAQNLIRIQTQDLKGQTIRAEVAVRCVDEKQKKAVFETKAASDNGQAVVRLPGNFDVKVDSSLRLEVEAQSPRGQSRLEQTLAVAQPAYMTHISTNKPVYNVGELLFFRTLTLERFRLQPPGKQLDLKYSIVNSQGQTSKVLLARTEANGVGGGEFALTDDLTEGEYTLVTELAKPDNSADFAFQPQAFRFFVRHEESPGIALDRSQYFQGDVIRGNFAAPRRQGGKPRTNEQVTVTLRSREQAEAKKDNFLHQRPLQLRTDALGNAQFTLPVPALIPPGEADVEIELQDNGKDGKIVKTIPVLPQWKVDFFPEGGTLVAGVANRVYCRVATPPGQKAPLRAELFDADESIARVQLNETASEVGVNLYAGNFLLTPGEKQPYKLKIFSGAEQKIEAPLPPAQPDGVALIVENPVGDEATPIECLLHTGPKPRNVLLVASCRGHVVDQQFVRLEDKKTRVQLDSGDGVGGVIRLTVYEAREQLIPLAERLLYRQPAQRLGLSLTANRKNFNYQRGEKAILGVQAVTEKGTPTSAWTAINVADANLMEVRPRNTRGLPDFFFLNGAVQDADDLENVQIAMGDKPGSQESLDRFLAIAGWRQFVEVKPVGSEPIHRDTTNQPAQIPPLFSIDNLHQIKKDYEEQLRKELVALRESTLAERHALEEEKERALRQVETAQVALNEYAQLPMMWLRIGVGLAVLALLGAGLLLLVLGFVRMVRRVKSASPMFAGACAALLVCLGVYTGSGSLRTIHDTASSDASDPLAKLHWPALPPVMLELERLWLNIQPVNPLPGDMLAARDKPMQNKLVETDEKLAQKGEYRRTAPTSNGYVFITSNLNNPQLFQNVQNQFRQRNGSPRFLDAKQRQDQQLGMLKPTAQQEDKDKDKAEPKSPAPQPAGDAKPPGAVAPSPDGAKKKSLGGVPAESMPSSTPDNGSGFGGADKEKDKETSALQSYHARRHIHQNAMQEMAAPGTLLWAPNLQLKNGTGQVNFDLPHDEGTYRIILQGHTESGRLGYQEQTLKILGR